MYLTKVIKCPVCGEVFTAGGLVPTRGLELHMMQRHPEFYAEIRKNIETIKLRGKAVGVKQPDGHWVMYYQKYRCKKCGQEFILKYDAIIHFFEKHWKKKK